LQISRFDSPVLHQGCSPSGDHDHVADLDAKFTRSARGLSTSSPGRLECRVTSTRAVGLRAQHPDMSEPVIGADAIRDGTLTRGRLRWNYQAVLPGVYLPKDVERTVLVNTVAAWLWTGRRGIIAGRAAAARGVFDEPAKPWR
jgi:hypothetical protein